MADASKKDTLPRRLSLFHGFSACSKVNVRGQGLHLSAKPEFLGQLADPDLSLTLFWTWLSFFVVYVVLKIFCQL